MAKIQERIKTDYKAAEESRGMVQQCACCKIRYRSHEVQPLCSDCEEQQQAAQAAGVEEAPEVSEAITCIDSGKDTEMDSKLTGIISIRLIGTWRIDFTWMDHLNLWISTAWSLSDTLRYVERLQARGLVCSYERRAWGHKGYWHILINADQCERLQVVVAEDHTQWLEEKAENDARYAASLVGNPEHIDLGF